jgi:hypothetical protein
MVTQQPFNADGALKTARAFHAAASQLEAAGRQLYMRIQRGEGVRPETPPPGTVGRPLEPEMLFQVMGASSGAVVLQTLALELVLKVRLARSGIQPCWTHNHAVLFADLPPAEKAAAETRYQARRHPSMKQSLEDVLAASAPLFEHNAFANVSESQYPSSKNVSTEEVEQRYSSSPRGRSADCGIAASRHG